MRTLAICLVCVTLACVVHRPAENPSYTPWVNVDSLPWLSNERGMAHCCPVAEHVMLTAKHVVVVKTTSGHSWTFGSRWSNARGEGGIVSVLSGDKTADLAILYSEEPLTYWYRVANKAPRVGSDVVLVGYDLDSQSLARTKVFAKVTAVMAGQILYDSHGSYGSSGGCVLNKRGEVVAVNIAGAETDNGPVGFGVSVWGTWNPLLELESLLEQMEADDEP